MMYAVTGHTQGIGKAIYEKLDPHVIGFSKSTGYNITIKEDRKKIIDQCRYIDVFINNAHDQYGQIDLLIELFDKWKDQNKTIINVGSRIADIVLPQTHINLLHYSAQKKALKAIHDDMQGFNCKVIYKTFAYVKTEKMLAKYSDHSGFLEIDQAVDIILND